MISPYSPPEPPECMRCGTKIQESLDTLESTVVVQVPAAGDAGAPLRRLPGARVPLLGAQL